MASHGCRASSGASRVARWLAAFLRRLEVGLAVQSPGLSKKQKGSKTVCRRARRLPGMLKADVHIICHPGSSNCTSHTHSPFPKVCSKEDVQRRSAHHIHQYSISRQQSWPGTRQDTLTHCKCRQEFSHLQGVLLMCLIY